MDEPQKLQTTAYVKVRGINRPTVIRKVDRDRTDYVIAQCNKYSSREITRIDYIKSRGYRFMAGVDM